MKNLLFILSIVIALNLYALDEINAESQRLSINSKRIKTDANKGLMLQGNVVIAKGNLTLYADQGVSKYSTNGQHPTFVLTGKPARFIQHINTKEIINGNANQIIYDIPSNLITLTGHASLKKNRHIITSKAIVYNVKTYTYKVANS